VFTRPRTLVVVVACLVLGGSVSYATDAMSHGSGGGGGGDCGTMVDYMTGGSGEDAYGHAGWGAGTAPTGWTQYAVLTQRENSSESDYYYGLADSFSLHARCDL
jgi:hypothetical protein